MDARLGYDLTFELDKFSNPKLRDTTALVKNTLLFILFSKPGQYPSLPHIGLDVQTLLFSYYDEITESRLIEMVSSQCAALGLFFNEGSIQIKKTMYQGKPSLLIYIEAGSNDSQVLNQFGIDPQRDTDVYRIGITYDDLNQIIFNITEGAQ
jgi:hypothetical protein